MANLSETPDYPAGVYQLETSDPVLGGPGGIANRQAEQLANRTAWLKAKVDAFIDGTVAVLKATKLATARTLSISGAGSGSASFDGSANANIALTLADSGAVAGTYPKVTVNAKGIVTGGAALVTDDIPSLDWSKINDGKPTTLGGYGITDAAPLASPGLTGNPTAPTPAQFDNDLSLVNSAFVQRALGSYSGATDVANGSGADANSIGKNLNIGAGGSYLPSTVGIPNGSVLHYKNTGTGTHTLSRVGTDQISCDGTTRTTIDVGQGDDLTLVRVNNIWIGSGSAALKYTSGFASSLANSGYQKLPSGLIVQWGTAQASVAGTPVTFPISFPSQQFAVLTGGASGAGFIYSLGQGLSGFTFHVSAGSTANHFWMAIGR